LPHGFVVVVVLEVLVLVVDAVDVVTVVVGQTRDGEFDGLLDGLLLLEGFSLFEALGEGEADGLVCPIASRAFSFFFRACELALELFDALALALFDGFVLLGHARAVTHRGRHRRALIRRRHRWARFLARRVRVRRRG